MNPQPQERERTPRTAKKKMNGHGSESTTDELATLFPAARSVTIAGRSVEIKPCGIAQAGRILSAGGALYALHVEQGVDLLELVESEPQAINAMILAATEFDAEWVTSLDVLQRVDLINEWLEVNGGFFVRRLLPRLARLASALDGLGAGRTSSTS